jgi:D-alanyl-lipoteichoic acid acyltransferase DltB (MBOAT superfamily)
MSFSLGFLTFICIVFVLFYLIRRRARAYFLLLVSLLFIAYLDYKSCIWVMVVTLGIYLLGLAEDHYLGRGFIKCAKITAILGIAVSVLSLFILKNSANLSLGDGIFSELILPIGFSYYIFQAIAYLADILSGKIKAEKNILFFALYMCYFPKFISGPIEEPRALLPQIKDLNKVYLRDDNRLSIAFPTILYGFFMKAVIADRLSVFTSKLFASPQSYGSIWLFAGMIMYTLQIYCDFAGYSALAVGISKVLGIELMENFFAPYLSGSINEFWRRWHISLSSWLKNYIYIPLGGNKKGPVRRYINVMLVFLICGMWHGSSTNFLVWGLLHGLYILIYGVTYAKWNRLFSLSESGRIPIIFGTVLTFLAVSFAWIFFGAPSLSSALVYVREMISFNGGEESLFVQTKNLSFTKIDFMIPICTVIVFLLDLLMEKTNLPIGKALYTLPTYVRYTVEYLLILAVLLLGIYGPGFNQANFMYMQF